MSGCKTSTYHCSSFWTFQNQLLETMRRKVWEEHNGLNSISHYQPCIPDKCHVVINFFYNSEAKLKKCYHTTMNNPHLTLFTKVPQRWWSTFDTLHKGATTLMQGRNIDIKINVVVSTLYWRCYYNIHNMLSDELSKGRWGNVATIL